MLAVGNAREPERPPEECRVWLEIVEVYEIPHPRIAMNSTPRAGSRRGLRPRRFQHAARGSSQVENTKSGKSLALGR